ncbi:bifunctional helix-turn-helix transcriptional regulator/GNAT family N-acetyltransferase [Chitinimonas naiadis]
MHSPPSAGELLREVARIYVREQRTQAACRDGASTVQCHVMTELLRQERLTQQALVIQLDLDKGWISRAVEALVLDGTVIKRPNIDDRRSAWLSLSPAGRLRARRLNTELNAHADQVLAKVPAAQHGVIRESLALLLQSLQTGLGQAERDGAAQDAQIDYVAGQPLEIRAAQVTDWPEILALLSAAGLPLEGAEAHREQYRVATQGSGLLAVGGLEIYGRSALLRSLAVVPRAQGTGLGQRMLESLIEQASSQGVGKLYLLTTSADGYFVRYGFTAVPRKAVPGPVRVSAEFQGACPATAIVMVRPL